MLSTPDPAMLAGYRAELLAAGLPEPVADRIVVSAADAVHRGARPSVPEVVHFDDPDGGYTEAEVSALIEARRAERAAELAAR